MVANQILQSRPLNVPTQLDSSLFPPDLWRILETASENLKSKEAQLLSKNSFSLRSSKRSKVATSPSSSSSSLVIEVVATAESVLLKVDDLLELCRLIDAFSSSTSSPSVCPRPSVVLKHFSSEARRLSQSVLNSNISLGGARDVLTRLQKLSPKGSTSDCPHGQKMFQLVYQI
jgi:hypothetical protein